LNKIVYDASALKIYTFFESMTGAKLKDCFSEDTIYFIVQKGQMGLALGKEARNLKRVEQALRKPVRLIEHDDNLEQFIRNVIYPLHKVEIREKEGTVEIRGEDTKTKGLLIGREKVNLKRLLLLVKRYFAVKDIKVI